MSLATLLVLADGRLPAGGHAHSGGLEAAVSAGRIRDLAGVDGFLRGRLATNGVVAAAFAAAACARFTGPGPAAGTAPLATADAGLAGATGGASVADLDDGMDARTPSPALRRASRAQGRALARAARAMWPMPGIGREPHHPVALGVAAAAAGLDPLAAATAAAHGTVTGPASAAVRLLGLDPYATHALIAALATECDRIAADGARRVADPVDALPAAGAPLLDIGAEHHASWEVRLFAS
ncbi:urease accessory UreF family protein [Actinoplanes sp. NPDC051633]|uniref:urease accessory protein UreF n=1 Tax=Actinoplanes sp. NPDC051633 TaxID=3155670 RepID=UPI003430C0DB